ncbi:MAG TPA: site-specific integrase [Ktedonobacterales bacterium]|nr:site-specific integrase [Ktedonobacterales bacterium]
MSIPPATRRTGKRGNNEGSITQLGDGRWQARVTLEGGKRKAYYGATRAEAAAKLHAALRDRDSGLPLVAEKQTVGQYLAVWLDTVKPTIRPRTWKRYTELLTQHATPVLGKIALAKLSAQQVQRLYSIKLEEGLSVTTVHHLHAVLHRALSQAERLGLVGRNVADLVDAPRMAEHEMHVLDRPQVHRFLQAARGDRLEALFVLAVTTGMRQGELLALRWRDVNLERGTVQIAATLRYLPGGSYSFDPPKTEKSRRMLPLTHMAAEALRRHRVQQVKERLAAGAVWQEHDLVFCSSQGHPLDGRNLTRRTFAAVLMRAGHPRVRFHDLRHTAATAMMSSGVPDKVASEVLGHANPSITTRIYQHVTPGMRAYAAKAMDAYLQDLQDDEDAQATE